MSKDNIDKWRKGINNMRLGDTLDEFAISSYRIRAIKDHTNLINDSANNVIMLQQMHKEQLFKEDIDKDKIEEYIGFQVERIKGCLEEIENCLR